MANEERGILNSVHTIQNKSKIGKIGTSIDLYDNEYCALVKTSPILF